MPILYKKEDMNNVLPINSRKEMVAEMQGNGADVRSRFSLMIPERTLEDVIVPEIVMNRLRDSLAGITHRKTLQKWGLCKNKTGAGIVINLFGPPGTGKTLSAEAIANAIEKKLFTVSYSDLESKLIGETAHNIEKAFEYAGANDAVLFFDEADSILSKRVPDPSHSNDHEIIAIRNKVLKLMEGFSGVMILATNLAECFDSAARRRITDQVEFSMPDYETRIRLLEKFIPPECPVSEEITREWLATETEGLSGGDIENLVYAAARKALRENGPDCVIGRTHFSDAVNQQKTAAMQVGKN